MMSIRLIIVALLLAAGSIGFQVDSSKRDFIIAELIHRDSYMSQLNNSSTSSGSILKESTKSNRINNFNSSSMHDIDQRDVVSEVIRKEGDYLMKINTGGQEKLLLLSTTLASTLIFCEPCKGCHNQEAPRFPFSVASTGAFQAKSTDCLLLHSYWRVLNPSTPICGYKRNWKQWSTLGMLSRVTSSFVSSSGTEGGQFHLWFVCVLQSKNDPLERYVEGVVGLGPGPYSLITQLARQLKMAKKFSYCLLDPYSMVTGYSKIIFGDKTSISTKKVTAPLTIKYAKPYYYLSLSAITVSNGSREMKIWMKGHHNIAIVSDTKTTQLPRQTYDALVEHIKLFTNDGGIAVPDDVFSLCYSYDKRLEKLLPSITLEFDNGERIKLPRANTFIRILSKLCLTIKPTQDDGGIPVLGTRAQHGFEVEYDLDKSEISFAKADCEKFGIQ